MYRTATESTVWASVEATTGDWPATGLYGQLETTEKGHASYRVGTVFAGVASHVALDIPLLTHRESLFGKSSGPRGDLVGLRASTGDWHGVEAKGKGPDWPSGSPQYVAPGDFNEAKDQAELLGQELLDAGLPVGLGDHWAVTTRASTARPLKMFLDDPSADDHGANSRELGPDFPQAEPFERLLQAFFQVVGDIENLVEEAAPNDPVLLLGDERYVGSPVPGSNLWVGAREDLFEARRSQRLSGVLSVP